MPHQVSYIELLDVDTSKRPLSITFTPDFNKITPELRQKQEHFIEMKHNCIRVAEIINEKLRNFLVRYSDLKKTNERELIYKLDFMKLREIN
jgi:hypothetical protein